MRQAGYSALSAYNVIYEQADPALFGTSPSFGSNLKRSVIGSHSAAPDASRKANGLPPALLIRGAPQSRSLASPVITSWTSERDASYSPWQQSPPSSPAAKHSDLDKTAALSALFGVPPVAADHRQRSHSLPSQSAVPGYRRLAEPNDGANNLFDILSAATSGERPKPSPRSASLTPLHRTIPLESSPRSQTQLPLMAEERGLYNDYPRQRSTSSGLAGTPNQPPLSASSFQNGLATYATAGAHPHPSSVPSQHRPWDEGGRSPNGPSSFSQMRLDRSINRGFREPSPSRSPLTQVNENLEWERRSRPSIRVPHSDRDIPSGIASTNVSVCEAYNVSIDSLLMMSCFSHSREMVPVRHWLALVSIQ